MSRRMGEISLEERQQIIMEYEVEGCTIVRDRHDIDNNTLQHIRFYHGKSNAQKRGYYHKDLMVGVKTLTDHIQECKEKGMSSLETAEYLDVALEQINKNWV